MIEATLILGRHRRIIHWNRSGHSTSELMLSTGTHCRPVAHSVGPQRITSQLVFMEQLKRRAAAAIRPGALGGALQAQPC